MKNIKDVVNTVIGNIAKQKPDTHDKLDRIWKNLLTEPELKHTKVNGIKEGGLFVNVDSPAWMHQMRTRQMKILTLLREEIPEIKHIRFKIGSVK